MRNLIKQTVLFIAFSAGICGVYTKTAFPQSWEPVHNLPSMGAVDLIAEKPGQPGHLFIAQHGGIYASPNEGKNWKQVLLLNQRVRIRGIVFLERQIFILSSEGLFGSKDGGSGWDQIFRGQNKRERNVLTVARHPFAKSILYLGTEGGLFQSEDAGQNWHKETNELGNRAVSEIKTDFENGELFIVTEKGLYRFFPETGRLDLVFSDPSPLTLDVTELEELPEENAEPEDKKTNAIYSIAISGQGEIKLAIGTQNGVLTSDDEGNRWEILSRAGLRDDRILKLVFSPAMQNWIAGTEKGIYRFDGASKQWHELYEGWPLTQIRHLELLAGAPELLYAATDDGLYRMVFIPEIQNREIRFNTADEKLYLLTRLFRAEPAVGQIQKEAVRYANVSNWKIKRWQWASRLKSLIPSFSIGKSFSEGDNIDIDRGGTNDPDVYILGPKDKNEGLDFDLDWELSDLVWNSAQTSIDSRDKLMVELRDDILSQVTRLYFERRRAQTEFAINPPAAPLEQMNAMFRIDELTASIDALTGGFLSKRIEKLYAEHPEFETLWTRKETGSDFPRI